jgi:hypothetical protein
MSWKGNGTTNKAASWGAEKTGEQEACKREKSWGGWEMKHGNGKREPLAAKRAPQEPRLNKSLRGEGASPTERPLAARKP